MVALTAVAVAIAWGSLAGQGRPSGTTAKPYTTWQSYAGGAHSSQYSALDQINKGNVGKLQVAWSVPITGTSIFNPVVVDGVMYAPLGGGVLAAIDAATGKELWRKEGVAPSGARGMNYWESPDRSDRRLIYLNQGHITAIDARTGQTITSFGTNGRVDLRTALWRDVRNPLQTSNPGRIYDDIIIMSLPAQGAGYEANPSDVHAYDVRTGKVRWVFHTIPMPGEFGYETWPEGAFKTAGGVHNWSELTVDEPNGIVFIPTGTGRFDFYGGNRHGANLFANSLVALDAKTGRRIWHQQLVHHDLWDFDLPQAPKLLTLRQNGRTIEAVAQATKMGFVFVFERKTGKPVFPIE
jgi:glucose dehydrogenase